jgi:hypothetical protein
LVGVARIVLSGCPVGFGSHLLYRFSLPPVSRQRRRTPGASV